MRFLENLVSGMIKDATGINARRMVRRIGGKNILLAGGAAVAGALAASQLAKPGGGTVTRWTGSAAGTPPPPQPPGAGKGTAAGAVAPPPPPPPPGATVAPPPPPPAAAAAVVPEAEPELPPEVLFPVVRTMAAAALADGEMGPEERAAVEEHLEGSGLDDEQVRRLRKDLVLPPSPRELAAMLEGLPADRAQEAGETLYRAAAAVLRADREVSEGERAWLDGLADALGFSRERQAELAAEVFG